MLTGALTGAFLFVVVGGIVELVQRFKRMRKDRDADKDAAEIEAQLVARLQGVDAWNKSIRSGKADLNDLLKLLK
jgi:hypothetical protein